MTTIDQYRDAKSTYLRLHTQAKKDLVTRFHQLEAEIVQVQRELRDDFGVKVTANLKAKATRASNKAAPVTDMPTVRARIDPSKDKAIRSIEKKLATQRNKLADAVSTKAIPQRPIQDRIYELEDELRLAQDA